MKVCPSCKTQYTDDSLAFCLQDGARLVQSETTSPTAAFAETETVVRNRDDDSEATRWRQTEATMASRPAGEGKSSSVLLIVAVIGLVLFVFIGGIAALAWIVLRPA